MAEIGQTLREARMRRRIDMTDVESATKIRAKYLRALENEEFELLPGPTFVKTFLRTYAEYLELDPRLLVEEYRQRYERPSSQDLMPLGGPASRRDGRRARRRTRAPLGPGLVLVLGVVVLLGALYLLGSWGGDHEPPPPAKLRRTPAPRAATGAGAHRARHRRPARVSVRLTATRQVYVCMVDARGRAVVDRRTLAPGQSAGPFRSRWFRANFGNGGIRMRVNGRSFPAAASSNPIGYELRPGGAPRRLSDSQRVKLCA